MSSLIEKAYANMNLNEIVYRLPNENAIKAFKTKIKNSSDIFKLIEIQESKTAASFPEVKEHINNIVSNMTMDEFSALDDSKHAILFTWLNNKNKERLTSEGSQNLSIKLLFNSAQPDNIELWNSLLKRVLEESEINPTHIGKILTKVDSKYFGDLLNLVLSDKRPEVIASILKIDGNNYIRLSELHKLVALKAYSKVQYEQKNIINVLDWKIVQKLKAKERFLVIQNYLKQMPLYKKIKPFHNSPTFEEFQTSIFPVSMQLNDQYNEILELYKNITENEKPEEINSEDGDEEESLIVSTAEKVEETIESKKENIQDQLNSSDWYFQDDYFENDGIEAFTFIRKSIWDAEQRLDEAWSEAETEFLETHIEKAGIKLEKFMNCIYECNGNDVDDAKQYLKSVGFIKKVCIKVE